MPPKARITLSSAILILFLLQQVEQIRVVTVTEDVDVQRQDDPATKPDVDEADQKPEVNHHHHLNGDADNVRKEVDPEPETAQRPEAP